MMVLGYMAALLIGITLGLIGGGGSILTVPVFVYMMGINPVQATAYSLFVVGITALAGGVRQAIQKQVDFKTGIVFAIPAFIAVYSTRKWLVPAIPDTLFSIQNYTLTKDMAIMVFFAVIMVLASVSMIKNRKKVRDNLNENQHFNYPLILLEGGIVGVVTGIVGAGGGFLIVPALVVLAKLPMKKAVGTSLLIIAVKSLIGFIGDVENMDIEWKFIALFSSISIAGIILGTYFSKFIPGGKLKKGFGWFVLIMGMYVLAREIEGA